MGRNHCRAGPEQQSQLRGVRCPSRLSAEGEMCCSSAPQTGLKLQLHSAHSCSVGPCHTRVQQGAFAESRPCSDWRRNQCNPLNCLSLPCLLYVPHTF